MRLVLTDPGHNPEPDSAELLREASRGDEGAWAALVERYSRRVYALARSRCRDPELAEEITQSVFATIAIKLNDRYTEQGKFEPWLFRVAMNRVRDEMRRLSRHAAPTDPLHFEAHGERAEEPDADAVEALRRAMDELGPADREVVELRHHGQLSFRQMAELLGEPVGTLLARHHRALRKLKELIEAPAAGRKRGTA